MPHDCRPRLILMADDDEDDRMLTAHAIRRSGLSSEIRFFEDGVALLDYLLAAAPARGAGAADGEIILLDINMPRKDGWAVLSEIRSDPRLSAIPVIFLSTSGSPDDVSRGYRMGASSFITKPGSFEELVGVVAEIGRYWFETVRLPGHA
jgi:CheY-like chemotaxis protein